LSEKEPELVQRTHGQNRFAAPASERGGEIIGARPIHFDRLARAGRAAWAGGSRLAARDLRAYPLDHHADRSIRRRRLAGVGARRKRSASACRHAYCDFSDGRVERVAGIASRNASTSATNCRARSATRSI
jgi:hypothetical protein